ncbi:fused MFS/spermidine synthase [Luteimonas sp. SDU101]|uniref:fused MFS/spermidine synthase n=1 Tax=unclassified Luteimonas TaxID=2629088 RepID=UPI003EB703B0
MRTFRPGHLLIDYTRTMMASLLFQPQPARIGMIGLGGGSQAKFCHRHLPGARLEVAENNPHVLALRRRFRVPDDDARLRVLLADGAGFVRERPGCFDILLVDGYDASGIPEALSSQAFYDDCRAALAPGGVLAGNLYATDFKDHVRKLQRSFGRDHVWVLEEARQSNRVVFAWTGEPFPGGRIDLPAVLARIEPAARLELGDVFTRVAQAWRAR